MTWMIPAWRNACLLSACAALAACSPALEWRDVAVDGRALTASFPCRPQRRSREVALAATRVEMAMVSCVAEGNTFAVAYADVADPASLTGVLGAWRRAAADNLGGEVGILSPPVVAGMTPNANAGRLRIRGRLPGGGEVVEHASHFVHGLRIYQASVLGSAPADAAVDPFFAGLRLAPR